MKRGIHLVGSVPLNSSKDVFELCSRILGERVRRLPDGETGERSNWIAWQRPVVAACPDLQPCENGTALRYRREDGNSPMFGELGYASAALDSWKVFSSLKESGTIRPDQRFQVSLPTPLAVVARTIEIDSQQDVEFFYTAALMAELQKILSIIPASELAIQWDVAIEFEVLEGLRAVFFSPEFDGVITRLRSLVTAVPAGAELGFHLCYGDLGHRHFKEPEDASLLTKVANAILQLAPRSVDWIHLPVPRERDDAEYFKPLRQLRLPHKCQLYLGLVHDEDAHAGARRRIRAAEQYTSPDFGIATECGFGRRDPGSIADLLQLLVEV